MRKIIMMLLIITMICSLMSCSNVPNDTKSSGLDVSQDTTDKLTAKNLELQSQIDTLNVKLNEYEKNSIINGNLEDIRGKYIREIENKYPEIKTMNSARDTLNKIVVYRRGDSTETKTLDAPRLIRYSNVPFNVIYAYQGQAVFSSGVEGYEYELFYGNEKVTITISGYDTFTISNYPGMYFVADRRIDNLGYAFLKKPSNYPDEPLLSKLLHSGVFVNNTEKYGYDELRRQTFVKNLIDSEKTIVTNPLLNKSDIKAEFEFFYFDQSIFLKIYNEYIFISDNKTTIYYKLKPDVIGSILGGLNAS